MSGLNILSIATSATIQDQGRVGYLRYGVTGGGAMDVYALAEGQALLGNGPDDAAIEFAEHGGRFTATGDICVAFSGAEMATKFNGTPIAWRRSLAMTAGDLLEIGAARGGVYGYLHVAGGFQTEVVLGARATHLRAGFGHVLAQGQTVLAGDAARDVPARFLPAPEYLGRREIRALWGPQSHYFSDQTRADFAAASFTVTAMRDRMGVRVTPSCGAIHSDAGLTIASDAINLGDIQITGDGTPAILLADRGSSGGYPRIATLASVDIGRFAQVPTGTDVTLKFVDRAAALDGLAAQIKAIKGLSGKVQPLVRNPWLMNDLLAYNLVGGMVRGDEHDPN